MSIQDNIEITKRMMNQCIESLMMLRRLDEETGTMDTKTFDAMLDDVCKEKWDKYQKMSKNDIMRQVLDDILKG